MCGGGKSQLAKGGKTSSFIMAFQADPSKKVQIPLNLKLWDVTE